MNRWQTQPLLEVEHLTMRFGGLVAINDLSFTVGEGDITALIGPNGAGKTTVFNCITGFYKPTEGRIALRHGDQSIWAELPAATRARCPISWPSIRSSRNAPLPPRKVSRPTVGL